MNIEFDNNEQPGSIEEIIAKELRKQNLTPEELKILLKQIQKPEREVRTFNHFYNSKRLKIGVFSDPHWGSLFSKERYVDDAVKRFNKEKVEAIYVPGDIVEGMSHREGHIFELNVVGFTNQMDYAVAQFEKFKQPIFFTTGNHDEWAKKKSDIGFLVGPELDNRVKHATFLGEYTARVMLLPSVEMRLTHEGSAAYALSYSGQKRINSLSGGTKPNIILNGHIHKLLYMMYRNIHYFECGTLQEQTPFMAMKGTPAMVGFSVLDISFNRQGINELDYKLFPYY